MLKFKPKLNTASTIFKVFLFVVAAGLIVYAFPREGRFRYQFQEGKPWRYGLLTAPYSFSIIKNQDELAAEKDSLLRTHKPYVVMDAAVSEEMTGTFNNNYDLYLRATVPLRYKTYLNDQLALVYGAGIISASIRNEFQKEKLKSLMMVTRRMAETRDLSSVFTVKEAYSAILSNLPPHIHRDTLVRICKVEEYLRENLSYDKETSELSKKTLLEDLSATSGIVQRGERIIDKGEIVNSATYLKLASLKKAAEERNINSTENWVLTGQIIWVAGLLLMLFLFLKYFTPEIYSKTHNILFLLILVTTLSLLSALLVRNSTLNIYMIPYAILPVMICTFFSARTAYFTHAITVLICSAIAPFPFEFLMLQLTVGMAVVFSLKELTQRSQLILCIVWTFVCYSIFYTGIAFIQEGTPNQLQWQMYVFFAINSVLMFTTYLLIYLFEWMFGYTSNVTLMELSNINSPLLRLFSESSPGTFQHSMQVSNLAAAAAQEINANAQLVRTGALYHDLGKMQNPAYFTENQDGGQNPLNKMETEKAAKIIVDHVNEGLRIANQYHLPKVVKDFITTHHGSGPARYFYTTYKNDHPGQEPPKEAFYYPGPNPFSKETAILMMADTVEAASHSLADYTEDSISELVEKLINTQIQEGAFKSVPITFQELETIKSVFKQKLKSIYHTRIAYPKENKEDVRKDSGNTNESN
ncbi:MAG: HDIG domain-containing protein [Bacteroidales bacterium]|nr:HDIG domain-containing protein [Bacteroidales bacterium]MDD4640078.1 HDIG domain-containing protein [Bacteroidales bacterium]